MTNYRAVVRAPVRLIICRFVPVSGMAGDNLVRPVSREMCSWYTGPTLVQLIGMSRDYVSAISY